MKNLILLPLLFVISACTSLQDSAFELGLSFERTLSGLDKKEIQLSDHKWSYLEGGQAGDPTVLLLHGFAAEKDNWTRMVRALKGYHVIAPDLPGHGETDFNENSFYGFDQQSLRVAEFVDALALKSFHIVGNSMGGGIAGLYAYRHPEKVLSISLIDAVGFYGDEDSDLQKILDDTGSNPLIVRKPEDIDTLLNYAMHRPPFIPWPVTSILARRAIKRVEANDQIFKHIYKEAEVARVSGAFTQIFSKLTTPAYVIWGDQDRVLHVSSVDKFFEYMPNVQVDVLPQIGHAPMLEVPEQTANMLQEFWLNISVTKVTMNVMP